MKQILVKIFVEFYFLGGLSLTLTVRFLINKYLLMLKQGTPSFTKDHKGFLF